MTNTTVASPLAAPCTRAFAGLPESVREARSWVAGFFAAPAALDAALMTSELVTNAITYTASSLPGGSVTVTVAVGDEAVRVDVIDQGQLPVPAARRHGLGQGLAIVAQLADVFGVDGCDRWFALRTGACVVTKPEQRIAELERQAAEVREHRGQPRTSPALNSKGPAMNTTESASPDNDGPATPDPGLSAIAADLAEIGGTPEEILALPGLDPQNAAELAMAMAIYAAAGIASKDETGAGACR